MVGTERIARDRRVQRAAGDRVIDVTAVALVSALTVRQGMGVGPRTIQEGTCTEPGLALLWDGHPRDSEGLGCCCLRGRGGTSFRGRRLLGTTDGPSQFCLAQAKL